MWWVFLALFHSVMVFVLPYLFMTQDVAWHHGRVGGYLMVGNMVYTYVVITVCLKAGLETDAWTALPDMPAAHCSCAFTTFKEKLHVIGGLSLGGPTGAMEVLSSK